MFRGMNVDIHQSRVKGEEQRIHRLPAMKQHILVGLLDSMGHQLVADHATVDIKVLLVSLAAREGR